MFIDSTKLESRAGPYTIVWRKSVEKHLGQVKDKLKSMTGSSNFAAIRFMLEEESGKIAFVSGKGRRKGHTQRIYHRFGGILRSFRCENTAPHAEHAVPVAQGALRVSCGGRGL